jgi:hypothetical protein
MANRSRAQHAARPHHRWIRRAHLALVLLLCLGAFPVSAAAPVLPPAATPAIPGLRVLATDSGGLTLELQPPAPELTLRDGFAALAVPGYAQTGVAGAPSVPSAGVLIGVPPGVTPTLAIEGDDARDVALPAPPLPAPHLDPETGAPAYHPDGALYAGHALYPQAPVALSAPMTWRDQQVVRLTFQPDRVDPAGRVLRTSTRLVVRVTWPATPAVDSAPSAVEESFRGSLLNYEQARGWRIARRPGSTRQAFTPGVPVYKIVVDHDALYQVTYEQLVAVDPALANADPRTFALSNWSGPVSIEDVGNGNSTFEPGEGFRFFGAKYHGATLEDASYTNNNVYWLSAGGAPGPRMDTRPAKLPGTYPVTLTYTDTLRAEESHHWFSRWTTNPLTQDVWFWGWHTGSRGYTQTYTVTAPGPATGAYQALFRADFLARSDSVTFAPHNVKIKINGQPTPLINHDWLGQAEQIVTATIAQSELYSPPLSVTVVVSVVAPALSDSIYFNWFEVAYRRPLVAENNYLLFTPGRAGTFTYHVSNFTNRTIEIYDVTHPLTPTRLIAPLQIPYETFLPVTLHNASTSPAGPHVAAGEVTPDLCTCELEFDANHAADARFALAAYGAARTVQAISRYVPPNLAPPAGADYVMVSPAEFMTATRTLAAYRTAEGFSVTVITATDVIEQYGMGIAHPDAYRNLFADAYANWAVAPTDALLVGDGNFNPKNYDCYTCFVPHYTEPEWILPRLAYADSIQGEIPADPMLVWLAGNDPLPEISLGRLQVGSLAEANTVVGKIMLHDNVLGDGQPWHRRTTCVADDPDAGGNFPEECRSALQLVPPPTYTVTLIAHRPPTTTPAIIANILTRTVNITGTAFLSYRGHGSVQNWDGTFLDLTVAQTLTNTNRYPVVLSFDCLDGFFVYPGFPALEEALLRQANAGSAGAFAPTGLGLSYQHDYLHRGFELALYQEHIYRFGLAADWARAYLHSNDPSGDYLLYQFTVFGDPALKLLPPPMAGRGP